ncbi:MAG: hypothetical protein VW907_10215 [Opitutae bacterium]
MANETVAVPLIACLFDFGEHKTQNRNINKNSIDGVTALTA